MDKKLRLRISKSSTIKKITPTSSVKPQSAPLKKFLHKPIIDAEHLPNKNTEAIEPAHTINRITGIDLVKLNITDPQNQYVDRQLASQILDIKPQTLAVWASSKRYNLPFYKVGRKVRYRVSDLLQFIENTAKI